MTSPITVMWWVKLLNMIDRYPSGSCSFAGHFGNKSYMGDNVNVRHKGNDQ